MILTLDAVRNIALVAKHRIAIYTWHLGLGAFSHTEQLIRQGSSVSHRQRIGLLLCLPGTADKLILNIDVQRFAGHTESNKSLSVFRSNGIKMVMRISTIQPAAVNSQIPGPLATGLGNIES